MLFESRHIVIHLKPNTITLHLKHNRVDHASDKAALMPTENIENLILCNYYELNNIYALDDGRHKGWPSKTVRIPDTHTNLLVGSSGSPLLQKARESICL
jgi:hypothetical protein